MTQASAHNPREFIGGNNPPIELDPDATFMPTQGQIDRLAADAKAKTALHEAITFGHGSYRLASDFLRENPTLGLGQDHLVREAKAHGDQMRADFKEIEARRKAVVKPFDDHVGEVNAGAKLATGPIQKMVEALSALELTFVRAERDERERLARLAREKAEAAKRAADEALRAEREAMEAPVTGEFVETGEAIMAAHHAVHEERRTENQARIAEKAAATVKLTGGTGRGRALKVREVVSIFDINTAALTMIAKSPEIPVKLTDLITAWGQNYKRVYGVVPSGFEVTVEEYI